VAAWSEKPKRRAKLNPFDEHERVLEEALAAVRQLHGSRLEQPEALEAGTDPDELALVRLDER
jgi:hypothetical protein